MASPGLLTWLGPSIDRYVAEIKTETNRFVESMQHALVEDQVPTCPEWTVAQLIRHVHQGHVWLTDIISSRSMQFLPPEGTSGSPELDDDWASRVAKLGGQVGNDLAMYSKDQSCLIQT